MRLHPGLLLSAGTILLPCGCSDAPDGTPPRRIDDLLVTAVTETTAFLAWTAPGDDGENGAAVRYDLRRSLEPLPENWETAIHVDTMPTPKEGGAAESLVVGGLENDRVYSLALTASDEAGNTSELSNVVPAHTGDAVSPAPITDLQATDVKHRSLTLQFTAPGDDGNAGRAMAYEVRYALMEITEATWAEALSAPFPGAPQDAGHVEQLQVTGLTPDTTYTFAVRAWDDGGHLGDLSNVLEVRLLSDEIPPATISNLKVARVGYGDVHLTWTAPGDDGKNGRARAYEIRWADTKVTEETWDDATRADVPIAPGTAGAKEEAKVSGLLGGAKLWFSVRAVDVAGNRAGVSNGVSAVVLGGGRTWRVEADRSGDAPTVQAGIDSAAHGDVVLVGPGRYIENIDLRGKRIHLVSAMGPETTILDGKAAAAPVVTCMNWETSETVIEGFTITGGRGFQQLPSMTRYGGGINCAPGTPVIRGNIIRKNNVNDPNRNSSGGGIEIAFPYDVDQPEPTVVEDNIIEDNFSISHGAGIAIEAECLIRRNVIRNNRSGGDGGGVFFSSSHGNVRILENEIVSNEAQHRGGGISIYAIYSVPAIEFEISRNIVIGNRAHGGVFYNRDCIGGGIYLSGNAWIHHNTVAFNQTSRLYVGQNIGAICVVETNASTVVEYNLVYGNWNNQGGDPGGITAYGYSAENHAVTLVRNLIYSSGDSILADANYEIVQEGNLFVDPLPCVNDATTRGELAENSPALTQPYGVIGAVATPGCGPKTPATSWGVIQSLHRP